MVRWVSKYVDHLQDQPVTDQLEDAMSEFWRRKAEWLPSWPQTVEERALVMYVWALLDMGAMILIVAKQ